jgi:hypothetical protein
MTPYESNYALDLGEYYAVIPLYDMDDNYRNVKFDNSSKVNALNTDNVALLSKVEIEGLIESVMAEDEG